MHRHFHDKLGSVYASRGELDAWWRSREARLEAENVRLPADGDGGDRPRARPVPFGRSTGLPHRWDEGAGAFSGTLRARSRWPVLAGVLALAIATVAYAVGRAGHGRLTEVRSLAVLPLQNLSNDVAQDYFADGITDALITNLAQIHELRVISRTSVMRFKNSKIPLARIARELDVDVIIEGSVQRSGERMRITIHLVDGVSDHHIWSR